MYVVVYMKNWGVWNSCSLQVTSVLQVSTHTVSILTIPTSQHVSVAENVPGSLWAENRIRVDLSLEIDTSFVPIVCVEMLFLGRHYQWCLGDMLGQHLNLSLLPW